MLYIYTWLTARNIWLRVIPFVAALWVISIGAGPLTAESARDDDRDPVD